MGRIRVGLSSWTHPELIRSGTFYPPEAKDAESRLKLYGENFSVVEVESSYYALLRQSIVSKWVERTPEDFVFHVKALGLFTSHPTKPSTLSKDIVTALGPLPPGKKNLYYKDLPEELRNEIWSRFRNSLKPLAEANKMGRVLLQFPVWFHPSEESREHILSCLAHLEPFRCSVEFKSPSWTGDKHCEETFSFLRENNLAFVCVDEPQGFKTSVAPIVAVTADIGFVRFRGRNADTWEQKDLSSSDRFNWYYTRDEMSEWIPRIRQMATQAKEVHALMTTNQNDQAVVNARLLQDLLDNRESIAA